MKVYRLSKCVFKKILCLLLILVCIYGCAILAKVDMQPARVMTVGRGIYLYNIQNDGTLKVFAIENLTSEGLVSLEIDNFSDYSLVYSKKLSFKEKMVVNQLITDVKENSEPYKNADPGVEDATLIVALIDEKHYYSTKLSTIHGGDIAVQNLLHKLVEISELGTKW